MQITQEQKILHAVWRKAHAAGEVKITLKSPADAIRLRFSLYNSVRAVRKGQMLDEGLRQAVEGCSIRLDGGTVTVMGKVRAEGMQAALDALGMTLEEVQAGDSPITMDDAEAAESLRKALEKLQQPEALATEHKPNPYYTRG
jgi:hypothetical protein